MRQICRRSFVRRIDELESVQRGTSSRVTVKRLAEDGLVIHEDGMGRPILTEVGTGFILANRLDITFFELCVLAKVYGIAKAMNCNILPLPTLLCFFEDWPVYTNRVQHALSRLRRRGLLPRAQYRRIICDVERICGMHNQLLNLSLWVDRTGEEIRNILLRS